MATKNLARTPLEAGNTPEFQYLRRLQRRARRRDAKAYCRKALRNPDACDAIRSPNDREYQWVPGYIDNIHDDKLSAVNAWVVAQAGRRWDDVYSDIRRRFDTRTLAGWHIVDAHLPSDGEFAVHGWRDGTVSAANGSVFVDEDGVLRFRPDERPAWKHRRPADRGVPDAEFRAWLAKRRIIRRGDLHAGAYGARYFWLVPCGKTETLHVETRRSLTPEELLARARNRNAPRNLYYAPWVTETALRGSLYYRQHRELTFDELTFFTRRLSKDQRIAAMDVHDPS